MDKKYSERDFLLFWRKFNIEYNQINKYPELIDEVDIYFDNKIGLIEPKEYPNKLHKPKIVAEPNEIYGTGKYKYNILKVIEKRNQEEAAIAELISEFEQKIDTFFDYTAMTR